MCLCMSILHCFHKNFKFNYKQEVSEDFVVCMLNLLP